MPDGTIHAEGMASTSASTAPPPDGALVLAGHFLAAVRIAAAACSAPRWKRNTVPILANLLLEVKDGVLTLSGTDMDMLATATAPAQGVLPRLTVSAAVLVALLSRLPGDAEVTLRADPGLGRVVIATPVLTAKVMTLPAEDFPSVTEGKMPHRFEMPAASLRRLLTLPSHAISTEETRYYLNGLYLEVCRDTPEPMLSAVATDGHRLAQALEPLPDGAGKLSGIIMPRKAVARLRALLDARATGTVVVQASDTRLAFSAGNWTLLTKSIDGTFPDWRRVVPHADQARARLKVPDPRSFARLLELATSVSPEKYRPVRLERRQGDTTVWIVAASPDQGEAELQAPADLAAWDKTGPDIVVGFQARYLRALAHAVPGGLSFLVKDPSSPMRADFPGGLAVLMPMRV